MQSVLVTGATGFLGHHVVKALLKEDDVNVIAIGGRPEDKMNDLPESARLRFYPLGELFTKDFSGIDVVINCSFARSHDPELLAQALDYTERIIARFEELKVKTVINISSQGVYKRLPVGELSMEESPISPVDLYSMVKYSTEKMFRLSEISHVINVRLASLMMPQRFLYFFIQKAKCGEPFTLTSPNQHAALLDVEDAASGLAALAKRSPRGREETFNLGIGTQYSLLEYADSVKRIGKRYGYDVRFDIADNGTCVCAGMDCGKIMRETEWRPQVLKDEMIEKLFNND